MNYMMVDLHVVHMTMTRKTMIDWLLCRYDKYYLDHFQVLIRHNNDLYYVENALLVHVEVWMKIFIFSILTYFTTFRHQRNISKTDFENGIDSKYPRTSRGRSKHSVKLKTLIILKKFQLFLQNAAILKFL